MAHLHDRVDRDGREAVEVLGERRVLERQTGGAGPEVVSEERGGAGQRRRDGEAAVAHDLGGHALPDLPFGARIQRQGEIRVRVNVDEAGRHDVAAGIDGPARGAPSLPLDGHDPLLAHEDVGLTAGRPGSVDDEPSADREVVHSWR